MQILQREDEVSGWVPEEEATGRFACMLRAACATYIVHAQTEKWRTDETNEDSPWGVSCGFQRFGNNAGSFCPHETFSFSPLLNIYKSSVFVDVTSYLICIKLL
jgi:hypothetical protein